MTINWDELEQCQTAAEAQFWMQRQQEALEIQLEERLWDCEIAADEHDWDDEERVCEDIQIRRDYAFNLRDLQIKVARRIEVITRAKIKAAQGE